MFAPEDKGIVSWFKVWIGECQSYMFALEDKGIVN
jgi:hypothetical protein